MSMPTEEKSYVGLSQCFFCGGDKNELLFDTRLRDSLPRKGVYNTDPCESCGELMEQGVLLIGVEPGEMEKIELERKDYQTRLDRLPPRKRQNAAPFLPNPSRTGQQLVMADDWVRRAVAPNDPVLADLILRCRWTFVESAVIEAIKNGQRALEESEAS